MGDMKTEEIPLPALFEHARKIYSAALDSSVDQEQLKNGIEALGRCDEMVSKLGLFSFNETIDDVSTTNLKYILERTDDFTREVLDERTQTAEMWHKTAASRAPFLKPSQHITCATLAQDVIEGRAKASQEHEHKHQPLIFGPASLICGKLTGYPP